MASGSFRFERFVLEPRDRRLERDDEPVELNARYLDALVLLVREAGKLVSKDRFLGEVWQGVPVTDEALTQCIKTLRRQLGDDAANPRFIETVPKHGYRFIAPVEWMDDGSLTATMARSATEPAPRWSWPQFLLLASAGTIGGGVAGIAGGLIYGLGGAYQPLETGMGAASVLLVLLSLNILAGLAGGLGVGLGLAAGFLLRGDRAWIALGGAFGGLIVGGAAKLLGLDTFNLLFGYAPDDITGGLEGAVLGAFIGLGAWLGGGIGATTLRRPVLYAGLAGAAAGLLIPLLGGRLMGGSLELLAHSFAGSRLRLDAFGRALGEEHFGWVSQMVFGGIEGFLFGSCVVAALLLAHGQWSKSALQT
jgi:DNA-binding winged helix-turn-helix (wHTH) protein